MSTSHRRVKKLGRVKTSGVAAILVATMLALPVSPSEAEVAVAGVRLVLEHVRHTDADGHLRVRSRNVFRKVVIWCRTRAALSCRLR